MALIKFVRNHKKKLIFIILVFGGSYWAIKRWMNFLKEASILFSPKTALLAERQLKIRKKTDHYLTIKKTSDEAIIELTKTLQDRLNKKFCTEEILESLKQKPPNKLELWENLKIACLSKCLASIYSICALSVLIKIHLNIVGACLFINNISFDYFVTQSSKRDQSIDLSPNVQKKYLENIENYVNDGVTKISSYVEEVNNEIFKNLSLKDNLTMDNVIEMFDSFKKRFKQDSNHLISTSIKVDRNVNKTLTVDLDAIDTIKPGKQVSKTDEDILNEINMDTLDIVTSCDFNNVFDSLVDLLSNEFINKLTTLMVQQVVRQESSRSDNFTIALPLAKLIPLMDKSHQIIQSDHHIRSSFLDDLKLNLFSENIYEAFSYIESGEDDQTDLSANQIASLTEAIKLFK